MNPAMLPAGIADTAAIQHVMHRDRWGCDSPPALSKLTHTVTVRPRHRHLGVFRCPNSRLEYQKITKPMFEATAVDCVFSECHYMRRR